MKEPKKTNNKIRLQKFLSQAGVSSRRGAEALIAEGKVKVNGRLIKEQGVKIDPAEDQVSVNGKNIPKPSGSRVYIAFHKPKKSMTTAHDPEGRVTVYDFLKRIKAPVKAVGRLDYDTEGLLLFTNDGDLHHQICHPSFVIEKEYAVLVKGRIKDEQIKIMDKGIKLEDGFFKPKRVGRFNSVDLGKKTPGTWLRIVITEGRNRIVRRFFAAFDQEVLRLVRLKVANIHLEGLQVTKYRFLTAEELKELKKLTSKK